MATVRRNGGIFSEETTLKDRVNKLGTNTPTTASGAQAIGASPKAQDMAGTKAAKKPVLEQAVAKEDTLEGTQRLDQPRQQATSAEDSAAQRATQLRQLGSLNNRVQSLIEQRLQQAGTAATGQATVKEDQLASVFGVTSQQAQQLAQDPASDYAVAQAALAEYAANPTGPAAEAALVKLTNAGVHPATAQNLINTSASATGQQVAANVADNITVADLDPTQLGYADLSEMATVLGVDSQTLAGMTVQQLQQQVEATKQNELAREQKLRAQLAGTPVGSARYQQLVRELGDLSQVGVVGSERQTAETVEEIQLADQVEIGDQNVSVEELLQDDNLSSLIVEYINSDPATRDRLMPPEKFGDLRSWIEDNQVALADLANTMNTTAEAFGETQNSWENLGQLTDDLALQPDVLSKLINWKAGQAVTSQDLATAQAELEASGVGQLAQSPEHADIIQKLTSENIDQVKGLTADELVAADQYARLANEPAYAELLGIDGRQDFVTDPNLQADIDELKPAIDTMKAAGVLDTWMQDDNFKLLNPQQMLALAEDPAQFKEFQQYYAIKEKIDSAETITDVLSIILGGDVTGAEMAELEKELQAVRAYNDVGAPGAAERLARFEELLDTNKDGRLDDKDFSTLLDRLKGKVDGKSGDVISGTSFDDLMGGGIDKGFASSSYAPKDKAFFDSIRDILSDKQVTKSELFSLDSTAQGKLLDLAKSQPWGKELTANAGKWQQERYRAQAQTQIANVLSTALGSTGEFYKLVNSIKEVDPHDEVAAYFGPKITDDNITRLETAVNLLKQASNQAENSIESRAIYDEMLNAAGALRRARTLQGHQTRGIPSDRLSPEQQRRFFGTTIEVIKRQVYYSSLPTKSAKDREFKRRVPDYIRPAR